MDHCQVQKIFFRDVGYITLEGVLTPNHPFRPSPVWTTTACRTQCFLEEASVAVYVETWGKCYHNSQTNKKERASCLRENRATNGLVKRPADLLTTVTLPVIRPGVAMCGANPIRYFLLVSNPPIIIFHTQTMILLTCGHVKELKIIHEQ